MVYSSIKLIFFVICFFNFIFPIVSAQEAKFEGNATANINNSKDAIIKLRIVSIFNNETNNIAFMVENTGKEDVCINALSQGNNEVEIRKPDGTFWKNEISKKTAYKRFKPSQNLIHTKLDIKEFFKSEQLSEHGYYEIKWIVDGKWESNTFIVYIPEPIKEAEKVEQPKK